MQVEFCTTTDNNRVINKNVTVNATLDIVFRQEVNEQAPVIVMNKTNLAGSNYIHIPDFKRYYFISRVDNYTANLVILHLTTDLLMTYKDVILTSQVLVTATEKPSYLSTGLPTQATTSKRIAKSDVTLKNESSLILTTIGGINKQVRKW